MGLLSVGDRIKERRERLGLKVYELANKVKVYPTHITMIEKRQRLPSAKTLIKILDALRFSGQEAFDLRERYIEEKYPEINLLDDWITDLGHKENSDYQAEKKPNHPPSRSKIRS